MEDNRPGPAKVFRSPFLILFTILVPLYVLYNIAIELRTFFKKGTLHRTRTLLTVFTSLSVLIFVFKLSSYPLQLYFYQATGSSFIEWKFEIFFTSVFIIILAISTILHINLEELGKVTLKGVQKKASTLTEDQLEELVVEIKSTVIDKEYFKRQGLTINELSNELEVSARYLSMALNQVMGQSFPEFINHCRIEKAKQLILSDKINEYSIEAIAGESGFNSRATFYRVFRKQEGMTPLEYRSENLVQ